LIINLALRPFFEEHILNTDSPEFLPAVISIAENAANEILEIYQSDFSVENKEDNSPLTEADMASHKIIIAGLSNLTPDIPILSEESTSISFETRRNWQRYWLVDPLDGTREFVKRNGEFTVNIALIENHQPVLGVVYVPVSRLCYFSSKGQGAYKQVNGEAAEKIKTKPASGKTFTVAGSRSHGSEQQQNFFTALGDDVEIIAIGSSLKLCLVAEGKVDIYPRFGPTSEWDTAAAHAVVMEAGGVVTDTKLKPLEYNRKESILNPHFLVIADNDFDWQQYLPQA
jgi:3'(2'), 5'-bisphosphate nucleotidase